MMEMSETGFFPQSIPIKFPRVPLWGKNPICIICIIRPFFESACNERKSKEYESKRAYSASARLLRTTCKNRKHELRERCINWPGDSPVGEGIKAGSVGHERTGEGASLNSMGCRPGAPAHEPIYPGKEITVS
jgi:hypothetical protein